MGRWIALILGLVFLVYTTRTALTQVEPGERAVVRRFGRIVDTIPEQGLYIGWPWGIEQVDRVPVGRVRRITVGFMDNQEKEEETVPPGQMLTGDHNLVNVQAEIYYKVRAESVQQFVLQADNIDALVARAAESILAEWIAGRRVDDALVRGKMQIPAALRQQLEERLQDYHLGLEIEQARITSLFPPEQVKESFEQVSRAETNIETQLNKAREESERRDSKAKEDRYRIRIQAETYARVELDQARTDARSFRMRLEQYRQLASATPDYINVLWLDEMTRLFTKMKEAGQIDLLDHYLTSEGLSITQFPLQKKKR